MNVLIIEDERLIAEEMQSTILAIDNNIHILGIIPSLKAANNWFMSNTEPDLIFCDIKLSDGLSFEIFEKFIVTCPVVFCTAYEEYAIRAFKVNSIDYLLKPVQEVDLKVAIEKVQRNINKNLSEVTDFQQFIKYLNNPALGAQQYKERFIINSNNKWIPVETKDIALFYKDTINFVYNFNGEKFIYDVSSLDEIEELLNPHIFFRANRQAIIHINAIQSVRPFGNQKLIAKLKAPLKQEIDISREKAPLFKKWMDR
ncbi:MAG: LytTR family DNA-binding domain-containing protein [Bacteroidota bacterium]